MKECYFYLSWLHGARDIKDSIVTSFVLAFSLKALVPHKSNRIPEKLQHSFYLQYNYVIKKNVKHFCLNIHFSQCIYNILFSFSYI